MNGHRKNGWMQDELMTLVFHYCVKLAIVSQPRHPFTDNLKHVLLLGFHQDEYDR